MFGFFKRKAKAPTALMYAVMDCDIADIKLSKPCLVEINIMSGSVILYVGPKSYQWDKYTGKLISACYKRTEQTKEVAEIEDDLEDVKV